MPTIPPPNATPICPHFYQCGGCDIQDRSYETQLAYKDAWLRELCAALGGEWLPMVGMPNEYPIYFRGKIRYGFVRHEGRVWPSRHAKGEEAADIPVSRCFLQSERSQRLMRWTADFATEKSWTVYDPKTGLGWLKHLLIREGKGTGDLLISLVSNGPDFPEKREWTGRLLAEFPDTTSLWHTVTIGRDNTQSTDRYLWGTQTIRERVGERVFYISPHAFFQTNGEMVETLYERIRELAGLTGQETVWDLYAGSATIGLYLADQAKRVISIESNPQNLADARLNLGENKVTTLDIYDGRVEDVLTSAFMKEQGRPDVIVVDPPRAGLSEQLRNMLPYLKPKRLVYVSCNPSTFVRDCLDLQKKGLKLERLQGIDMFPHTLHCELIGTLS